MDVVRILIADDHTLFREGLKSLLSSVEDMSVVGETATGESTIAAAAELQPDVILMDIQMPEINGIEATRRILHTSPHIGVVACRLLHRTEGMLTRCCTQS